jgi:hypothetical protein
MRWPHAPSLLNLSVLTCKMEIVRSVSPLEVAGRFCEGLPRMSKASTCLSAKQGNAYCPGFCVLQAPWDALARALCWLQAWNSSLIL